MTTLDIFSIHSGVLPERRLNSAGMPQYYDFLNRLSKSCQTNDVHVDWCFLADGTVTNKVGVKLAEAPELKNLMQLKV